MVECQGRVKTAGAGAGAGKSCGIFQGIIQKLIGVTKKNRKFPV
jgi:hypothetical protein